MLLATTFVLLSPAVAPAQIQLGWPAACRVGETCEIQHYVDHGTGAAQDHRCGSVTYRGHNGTDIRIPTIADEKAGVDVLAAAPGKVLRARDDMPDISISVTGRDRVRGRECGNGLVIAHGDGFETQYCHMAEGSIAVKPGDEVAAGQRLGRIGLSGDTEFPHLHFTIRHKGEVIDPFAYGLATDACGEGVSLWRPEVQALARYKAGVVLNAGFAAAPVTMERIEAGAAVASLKANSPAIVAFARAITLRKGDVQRIVVTGPDGVLADYTSPALDNNKAQVFVQAGRRKPASGWRPGPYSATYTVTRDGQIAIEKSFTATLQQ